MRLAQHFAAALVLLTVANGHAHSPDEIYAKPGSRVDIGGRKLNLYCTGKGSPTVVLESGLGGRASQWAQVQPMLARRLRTCSYDRAGYAFSDPGPTPRSAAQLARELSASLSGAKERGPYVLVASTFGAFVVRLFAGQHPQEIAGMVLLNPSPEDEELTPASPTVERIDSHGLQHAAGCRDAAKRGELSDNGPRAKECLPPPNPQLSSELNRARIAMLRRPNTWGALVGEWQSIRVSAAEVRAARDKRFTFPLISISAGSEGERGGSSADKAALHEAWLHWTAWQDDMAKLSSNSLHVRTRSSDRAVESSEPELVVSMIEKVITASRDHKLLRR